MPISKPAVVFHSLQIFFSFIAMCCFASVASFQAHWHVGPSALSGFAVFVAVTNLLLALFLVLVPVVYDKYNKLSVMARALRELRVAFILIGTGLGEVFLVAFIATISAWTEAGCKNPANDPNAKNGGKDYQAALPQWCQTKKAGSIFFWLSTIAWIASFVLVVLDWREGRPVLGAGLRTTSRGIGPKPKDPPFRRPTHDDAESIISREPSRYNHRRRDDDDDDDSEIQSPFADPRGAYAATSGGGQGRSSMDMYGAFSDPTPSGYSANGYGDPRRTTSPPAGQYQPPRGGPQGMSRTMALAYEDTGTTTSSAGYDDPYERVRASLATPRPGENPPNYQYRPS
ncbi:hypothetical protein DL93DRAFT_2054513 [Clavulina sp. PMI_390]|nr:hypothetical protein DL93DRAFT_2054513 [Clavulina sp. PMI_390]